MPTPQELGEAVRLFASGVIKGNLPDTLGAPIDLINALSPKSIQNEKPALGSKHIREMMFGANQVEDANVAETAGSMFSAGGAVKALIIGAARLGKISKTADVAKAQELINTQGNVAAFNKTGIYQDSSTEALKAVISDRSARILDTSKAVASGESLKLSDALDHPLLYKMYPELADVPLALDARKNSGSMLPNNSKLTADLTSPDIKAILLHEAQHGVQNIEKFAGGGNPRMFYSPDTTYLKVALDRAAESSDPAIKSASTRFRAAVNTKLKAAHTKYENLPGEQEARFTDAAKDLSFEEVNTSVYNLLRSGKTPQSFDTK